MNTLIQANIFFFITSVVTIVLAIGVAVLLYYIIRIARNVEHISEKIKIESDHVTRDIHELRTRIREEGMKVIPLIGFFSKFFTKKKESAKTGPRRKNHKHEPSSEEGESDL
ncbi:MAG: hypothetical protein RL094_674 [Candidatus Parcubacteria bacterium]|jgi:hypothetical protein